MTQPLSPVSHERLRDLNLTTVVQGETRCQFWELSFEGERVDGWNPNTAFVSLQIIDNQYQKPEFVILTTHTTPSVLTNQTPIDMLKELMDFVDNKESTFGGVFDNLEPATWNEEDILKTVTPGETPTIPRWVWSGLMEEPAIRVALSQLVENLRGETVNLTEIPWTSCLPHTGHLRVV